MFYRESRGTGDNVKGEVEKHFQMEAKFIKRWSQTLKLLSEDCQAAMTYCEKKILSEVSVVMNSTRQSTEVKKYRGHSAPIMQELPDLLEDENESQFQSSSSTRY